MEIQKLCNDIEKILPKFFDNFENWEYGNGTNAGKDFKRIFNRARRISRAMEKSVSMPNNVNNKSKSNMKEKIEEIVDSIVLGALSQTEATEELLDLFSSSDVVNVGVRF